MPVVFIPASLHRFTGGVKQLELPAKTVGEVVDQLDDRFPGIRQRMCEGNRLKPGLAVAVDSRISDLGMLQPIDLENEVHFVFAVGGG